MNRLCRLLVFACAWGVVCLAQAASVPFVDYGQQVEREAEPVELPEPTQLKGNWWRFFEVEGKELEQRIQQAIAHLQHLSGQLPEGQAVTASQFIERIEGNLRALPQARAQSSPRLPLFPDYAEAYTISQLLDIAGRLRALEARLAVERDEIESVESTIKAAHRRIDTQLAAYLNLSPVHPERLLRGLEIMSERSAVALTEEQLRVHKGILRVSEARLQQLVDEAALAADRLVAGPNDLPRLSTELEQAQAVLEQAGARLTNAQASTAQARAKSIISDDREDQATALYRQQQAVYAAVAEARARVHLITLQAERHLAALLLDRPDVDIQALREQLATLNAELATIHRQASGWERDSARERGRAGETMARALEDEGAGGLTFFRLLNQERLDLAQQTLVAAQRLEESIAQAHLLIRQLSLYLARREGLWQDWLARSGQTLGQFWDRAANMGNQSLFKIKDTPVTALGLLRVLLILLIAWFISHWLRRGLRRLSEGHEGVSQAVLYTIQRFSHYVIIGIGLLIGLYSIGIDLTNFALVAGAIGIGIGFGLQSIVNNFVSGLILLFERSLKVGDFVELSSGVAGEVREINVRSTRINTNDNVDIVVPNSQFINHDVINWTLDEDYRRIHIPFKVAYGSNKDSVKQAALEAADRLEHTLQIKKPSVWLVDFDDNGLRFELVVWVTPAAVKRPGAVNAAYKWEIETALGKYGIEIPVPQRDLRLRNGFKELFRAWGKRLAVINGGRTVP